MLLRLFYLLGRQKGNSWKNSQNANTEIKWNQQTSGNICKPTRLCSLPYFPSCFFPHKSYLSGFKVWFPKPLAPDLKICEKWSYSQDPMRNADSQTHFRPSESEIEGGSQWSESYEAAQRLLECAQVWEVYCQLPPAFRRNRQEMQHSQSVQDTAKIQRG